MDVCIVLLYLHICICVCVYIHKRTNTPTHRYLMSALTFYQQWANQTHAGTWVVCPRLIRFCSVACLLASSILILRYMRAGMCILWCVSDTADIAQDIDAHFHGGYLPHTQGAWIWPSGHVLECMCVRACMHPVCGTCVDAFRCVDWLQAMPCNSFIVRWILPDLIVHAHV